MAKIRRTAVFCLAAMILAVSLIRTTHSISACRRTKKAAEYTGKISTGTNGQSCLYWSSVVGNTLVSDYFKRKITDENFPDGDYRKANNYCRNPDDDAGGPWCYTGIAADGKTMYFSYCAVPFCECRMTKSGQEYQGKKSTTKSGLTCQAWASQSPHQHTRNTAGGFTFPDGNENDAENYCRNPDNTAEGPWCYTTNSNVRWEYCDIPKCDCRYRQPSTFTFADTEYYGTGTAEAETGIPCQAWTSQYPHSHDYLEMNYNNYLYNAKNYCRNPLSRWLFAESRPWCFTTDPDVRWDYCDLPLCQF